MSENFYKAPDDYPLPHPASVTPSLIATHIKRVATWLGESLHELTLSRRERATRERMSILDPNQGSDIKIERYCLGLTTQFELGKASALELKDCPDTTFRPQRFQMNAPCPGFIVITEIKVANVSVTIGGTSDAYVYSREGIKLDVPTLTPANNVKVFGNYTGLVPAEFGREVFETHDILEWKRLFTSSRVPSWANPAWQVKNGTRQTSRTELRYPGWKYTFCVSMQGPATIAGY